MHHKRSRLCSRIVGGCAVAIVLAAIAMLAAPRLAHSWSESDFENRPLVGYPIPTGHDDLVGSLQTYTIRQGDTLQDLAKRHLGNRHRSTEIHDLNVDVIGNNPIQPDTDLVILPP